jgi:cell wall-associated NlpC family hydrolase
MSSELEAPLVGCEYRYGSDDCYGLVRRWYWQTRGIVLRDFPRGAETADGDGNAFTAYYAEAGFLPVPLDASLEVGDMLLMRVASRNHAPNHSGVYVGGDLLLHHLPKRLSMRESLPRYRDRVTHILRYKEAP